jgi:hypothetical protein
MRRSLSWPWNNALCPSITNRSENGVLAKWGRKKAPRAYFGYGNSNPGAWRPPILPPFAGKRVNLIHPLTSIFENENSGFNLLQNRCFLTYQ